MVRSAPIAMEPLDILSLDRSIARATSRARTYLRRLRADPERVADDVWFGSDRMVTTRATFVSVTELPASDPLRESLRRWVYALAVARIAQPIIVRAALARNARALRFARPEDGTFSVREVTAHVLAERSDEKRAAWLEALADSRYAVDAIRTVEHGLAEAVVEIETRLGETPMAPVLLPYPRSAVAGIAQGLLNATRDLAEPSFKACGTFGNVLGLLVASDVPGVWPAQPSARWLSEMFGGSALLEGINVDVGHDSLRCLGASSFARAMCRFGAAYARAAAPKEIPFVVAHDATLLHPYRRGALFGSLIADPVFLKARLGFSRDTSRTVARSLASTFLGAARLEASRSIIDFATAPAADIEGVLEAAFFVPYPRALAGVLPKPRSGAPVRLAALLLAAADRESLVQQYDEDWFRNPRALAHLRELDAVAPPAQLDEGTLTSANGCFANWLGNLAN